MDAPRHFLAEGATIDQQALEVCSGPARIVDLTPVEPGQLFTVADLLPWADLIQPGDRLLFRTDWHKRFGSDDYRNALPRISPELAQWLVDRRVALIGVEPPSVADVNDMVELTEVHRILLGGNVCIVEGLANLDQLECDVVEFTAFPLRVSGGDGCPVRAVACECVTNSIDPPFHRADR
jgi:kynurenine formamidase